MAFECEALSICGGYIASVRIVYVAPSIEVHVNMSAKHQDFVFCVFYMKIYDK